MDMQGTPIGSTNQGMKNTSDPERYNNPTTEGAGSVASDSLAAESARSGGKFGDNRDSQPLKQSGSSSTFNNTDTSSATELPPAPNAAEREAKTAWEETSDEAKGPGGKKYPEGADGQSDIQPQPMDGKPSSGLRGVTGPSASMGSTGGQQMSGGDAKSGPTENTFKGEGSSDFDAAPGYVGSVASDPARTGKPKGKNITEGGFDEGDEQNASFNSDIGDENDPGRKAENDMQRKTQSSSGSSAPRQKMGESDDNQYGGLDTDQNLHTDLGLVMAEAVTAVGLGASVVQLISATVKAYQYLNDVKNAPKERAKLSLEAANLLPLLNTLRDQVENADPNDPWIESVLELGGPDGPLELFKRTMDQLKRKLKTESPMLRLGKHLVWTLSKDDIHQILAHIERFKSRLMLALQKDNMKLSRAIKTDTAGIEPLGLRVQSISKNLDSLSASMYAQGSSTLLEKMLSWLSPVDSWKDHDSATERRVEGTGQWFLSSREFVRWRDGANETLFCSGIPGAGKTIIASLVIDHLSATFVGDGSTVVLYLYCFYKDRSQQTLANIIAGLLKQLIQALKLVPDQIEDLYESSMRNRSRPKQEDLSKILRTELRRFRKVFVVVDALDEYSESEAAQQSLLDELQSLRGLSNLMVTSRPVSPFIDAFDDAMHIAVSADNADVRRYLTSQMSSLPRCVRNKPALQELIVQTITGAVEGMFLLARLHVRSLVDKVNTRKIEDALKALPKGSDPAASNLTYDETVERINSQEPGFRDLAFTIISWISLAHRPLTVTELLYALSIEPGDTAIDEANFVDEETLTSVCAGFVVIDRGNGSVRLAHYTMQEYFDRRRCDLFKNADTDIAMTCITYLLFDEFSTYTEKDLAILRYELRFYPEKADAHSKAHPLFDYATNYWGYHLVHSDGRAVRILCLKFLGCYINLAASMAVTSSAGEDLLFANCSRIYPDDIHGLWVAAKFGLNDIVSELLDTEGILTSTGNRRASDALSVAVCYDNRMTVELLIEKTKGIIVVAEGSDALHYAVRWGKEFYVSMLLRAGAKVNSGSNSSGYTPLNYAVRLERAISITISNILLAAGADVDGGEYPSLWTACRSKNTNVVRLLLEHGADPARNSARLATAMAGDTYEANYLYSLDRSTALHYAESSAMVSLLVQYGADVNAANTLGWAPLHIMAAHYICPFRHQFGAMDSLEDTMHATAVLLLQNGACVKQRGYQSRTPLHCAMWSGDTKVARLLLETGAEVDARDDFGYPALAYAHCWYWEWKNRDYHKWARKNCGTYAERIEKALVMKALLVEFGATPNALADEILAKEVDPVFITYGKETLMSPYSIPRDELVRFLLMST